MGVQNHQKWPKPIVIRCIPSLPMRLGSRGGWGSGGAPPSLPLWSSAILIHPLSGTGCVGAEGIRPVHLHVHVHQTCH